jgi:hypothetical protein
MKPAYPNAEACILPAADWKGLAVAVLGLLVLPGLLLLLPGPVLCGVHLLPGLFVLLLLG